jgi:hypothetical protein
MRNYKVSYLREDYSIRYKYVSANSSDEARLLVYNDIVDCIQTLSAECTQSISMLNGDMANEFNDTHY